MGVRRVAYPYAKPVEEITMADAQYVRTTENQEKKMTWRETLEHHLLMGTTRKVGFSEVDAKLSLKNMGRASGR